MRLLFALCLLACSRSAPPPPASAVPAEESAKPVAKPKGELELTVFNAHGATLLHELGPKGLDACRTEPMIGWVIVEADVREDGSTTKTVVRERVGVSEAAARCLEGKLRFAPPPAGIDKVTVYIALR